MLTRNDTLPQSYTPVRCPVCAAPMRLLAMIPMPTGADEITYRCEVCKAEHQQTRLPQASSA